jgi:NAD(P)H dehydrogenase (quinone)
LRILVVYAHPLGTSFVSALHARVVETLRAGGHSVDDLDLYAERFDPVMSREQMLTYVDTKANTREVESYVARLRAAEALVLVFPVWYDGLPAIMQGYFQRVFLPGVSMRIDEAGLFHPHLLHLKRLAAVCAYGESQRDVAAKRNPARRFVRYNIGALINPHGRFEYITLYDMNFTTAPRRAAFLKRVTRVFEAW